MHRLSGTLQYGIPISMATAMGGCFLIGSIFQIELFTLASFYLGGVATSATILLFENKKEH
ncbi:hypothetical protein D3C81_436550 [compost metagenome]